MAKFEGVKWAPRQLRYMLPDKSPEILEGDARIYAVSKSVFYANCLCFEGIRFHARRTADGGLEVAFLNWDKNLERFRRGIAFNVGRAQQAWVPEAEELEQVIVRQYFRDPQIRAFLEEMAATDAQGYLRPFTVDEEMSMGVTFPAQPSVHAIFCRYDNYLGEPFAGVVIPDMVRAVGQNGTGWLKLGINYLVSLKAIDEARTIDPGAAAALFLDDRWERPLDERHITEWDSSCCLFGLRDGTVVKIPEHNLILPSVTIQGMTAILRKMGVPVEERFVTYAELRRWVEAKELTVIASIGTAGIMNRCHKLSLVDAKRAVVAVHVPDQAHPLWARLAEAKKYYWDIYKEKAALPNGMKLFKYSI